MRTDAQRAADKRYYQKVREEKLAKQKRRRDSEPQEVKQKRRAEYYAANAERLREQAKRSYEKRKHKKELLATDKGENENLVDM